MILPRVVVSSHRNRRSMSTTISGLSAAVRRSSIVVASSSWSSRSWSSRLSSSLSSSSSISTSSWIRTRPSSRERHIRSMLSAAPSSSPSIASLVRQLRDATGAPMMECKKALSSPDVDGDVIKATEWLRKHGSAKVLSKVSGREANEGLVGMSVAPSGNAACVVRVSSETDFASRSDVLSKFVQEVADAASASNDSASIDADVSAFLSETTIDGRSLDDRLNDAILSIRENIRVESIMRMKASSNRSILAGYVHGRSSPTSSCGSAASIVELVPVVDGAVVADEEAAREAARRLAMHVVASSPKYGTISDVPDDVIEAEREIYAEKARGGDGGKKSPEIIDKIVTGQLRKFYEGNCLSEQMHMVEDGNPKVSKYLADMGYAVRSFVLVRMGG